MRFIPPVIVCDANRNECFNEVNEYVVTEDIERGVCAIFEVYNSTNSINSPIWISGALGCGKSYFLKTLGYVLENRKFDNRQLGELFANKIVDNKLRKTILTSIEKYPSETIIFNFNHQILNINSQNAILKVFYKVFYDHQGFCGFQPHVAEFENYLTKEGNYEAFKMGFKEISGKDWQEARQYYKLFNGAIAEACSKIYTHTAKNYEDYLDSCENKNKISIEDFSDKVNNYINSRGANFKLNFLIDDLDIYFTQSAKKQNDILALQNIIEVLEDKTKGRSLFIFTISPLERINEIEKLKGKSKLWIHLAFSNFNNIILERLLKKNINSENILKNIYTNEAENLKNMLSYNRHVFPFQGFRDDKDFIRSYPFVPYQFDFFWHCVIGWHNSTSSVHLKLTKLQLFQNVLKRFELKNAYSLVAIDDLYNEDFRLLMPSRSCLPNYILNIYKSLNNYPFAVKVMKALVVVKYYKGFQATFQNISFLLLDSFRINKDAHFECVKKALLILEEEKYIEEKGGAYELLENDKRIPS
jgi:hypothetical protein